MPLKLIIRHWTMKDKTSEHSVEPSEPVMSLIPKLVAFWGIADGPNDPVSLQAPSGLVLDPAGTFLQAGLNNGDILTLGPRSQLQSFYTPPASVQREPQKITLRLKECEGRKLRIHPMDARSGGLDEGDLLRLKDEISGTTAAGIVEVVPETTPGTIETDPMTIDCLGASPDQDVVVEKYPVETLKRLTGVTFGIKPQKGETGDDLLMKIREKENELLQLTNRRVVVQGQMFRWREMNVNVQVLDTDPKISGDEVGLISTDILKGFGYRLLTDEASFDGILMIDLSFSMEMDDMAVRNIQQALSYMAEALKGDNVKRFLQSFKEGASTERYRGAILATLMYLVGKVSRGKGERIAVILFSDAPQLLQFSGESYFDASASGKNVNDVANTIVAEVEKMKKRSTKAVPALRAAVEVCKKFGPKKPKMIVMLTDGRPEDAEAAEELIRQTISPRMDLILFIAGIGEEIDEPLMKKWTEMTGGEYLKVTDLNQLAEWYSTLAKKLTLRGKSI